jgi:hypothetical protein
LAELEPTCCPPMVDPPMVENPCLVCPDGVTFDGEFEFLGATTTCFGAIELAMQSVSGSDECAGSLAELEPMCCPPMVDPPMVENLCLVYPDGVTFDGEFEFLGATMTCFGAIELATQSISGSDECAGTLAELEPTCAALPWLRIPAWFALMVSLSMENSKSWWLL